MPFTQWLERNAPLLCTSATFAMGFCWGLVFAWQA